MNKVENALDSGRVVAVLRGLPRAEVLAVASALSRGGVKCIEITMTSPNAFESIEALASEMPDVVAGAGTITQVDEVKRAAEAGAQFIVSPHLSIDIIRETKRFGLLSMPGAMTPTEVHSAFQAGAGIVKVFPASVVGPQFFREMRGPFPSWRLLATGGVTVENAAQFVKSGAYALGLGTSLVLKELVAERRYDELESRARLLVASVQEALR